MIHPLIFKFEQYHINNPQVYEVFKIYADKAIKKQDKYSAWLIINIIRWETPFGSSTDQFKISNNFISLYARKLMREYPRFRGYFNIRFTQYDTKKDFAFITNKII